MNEDSMMKRATRPMEKNRRTRRKPAKIRHLQKQQKLWTVSKMEWRKPGAKPGPAPSSFPGLPFAWSTARASAIGCYWPPLWRVLPGDAVLAFVEARDGCLARQLAGSDHRVRQADAKVRKPAGVALYEDLAGGVNPEAPRLPVHR